MIQQGLRHRNELVQVVRILRESVLCNYIVQCVVDADEVRVPRILHRVRFVVVALLEDANLDERIREAGYSMDVHNPLRHDQRLHKLFNLLPELDINEPSFALE